MTKNVELFIVVTMPKAKAAITSSTGPFSRFSSASTQQMMYVLLLICTFLIGYLVARVQSLEEKSGGNAVVAGTQQTGDSAQAPAAPQGKVDVALGDLPPLGNKNAKVKIVEFSDFQCPFCRTFWKDTLSKIKTEYIDTGKVVIYYRHYPLSFHPMAQASAEAAECANEQEKFWEFHDTMYEEQGKKGEGTIEYTNDDLKTWAGSIGVNTTQFNECLDNGKYKEKVAKDQSDGTTAGVNGTPGFFINGTSLVGAQPFESFKTAIEAEL